jgi:hypothetical protein
MRREICWDKMLKNVGVEHPGGEREMTLKLISYISGDKTAATLSLFPKTSNKQERQLNDLISPVKIPSKMTVQIVTQDYTNSRL